MKISTWVHVDQRRTGRTIEVWEGRWRPMKLMAASSILEFPYYRVRDWDADSGKPIYRYFRVLREEEIIEGPDERRLSQEITTELEILAINGHTNNL